MNWPAPADFVHGEPLPPPGEWGRAGLVMVFNLECAACVSRGLPFLKRLHTEFGHRVELMALHTSRGHRLLPREDVEPTVTRFARDFARLPFPVALDVSGDLARAWGTEGTPHWFAFAPNGELVRSVYGSQENAQTRLAYLLEELAEREA
ncbi:alkyl hydroperoxide reductase [Deinococcus aetherius]|uniref:Alkyl hydroperoxide reductase n=1 Tax=Deinococcus aetherius TaxID=200252 RepID=A0ABM8AF45_9DEIO|nr:TlpA disulfide reductase family protein [Deinococcus aetherius]BDP42421.1 alkyl hydroperoxide reductase [Deinococcus aetherius]